MRCLRWLGALLQPLPLADAGRLLVAGLVSWSVHRSGWALPWVPAPLAPLPVLLVLVGHARARTRTHTRTHTRTRP